ncbi:CpaE family protein [Pseudarthrobacter sp. NPDC058362]|uniref:AAA family ATPase n=1 Tax=Pseudarthrobacter sp. NPDC058362 TaxID=3346458 RepID=UPI003651C199
MGPESSVAAARLKRPSWKDPRLVVGILLVLASVAGVISLLSGADRTTEVFAARNSIGVGERITAENLIRTKVRLGETEQHYITAASGLPENAVAIQRIGKDQLVPRTSLGVVDALDRKPVALTVSEALPAQAVAGARVDVWVAQPDARNGFNEPRLLLPGAEIAEAVEYLTGQRHDSASSMADTAASLTTVPADPREEPDGPGPGRIIALWGPAGSPGRTTLAVNVAGELAAEGKDVILVDADSYGASVAAVLGLLDESAGLAQACRLADQGVLDAAALAGIAAPVATALGRFRVLTGITRADRWTELRAPALAVVLERARQVADVVVVDTGFCLEADEELSFDTMAPRRNAATLRSLELADTLFAIGAADPVGVPRLVRALAELEAAVPQASPVVVMNKVRASSVGRGPERQLQDAWHRYGPEAAIHAFLPFDGPAADAALLGGSLLLECAPDSGLRHAIRNLVCAPAQQNRKSSVFSSTAGRRAKD